MCYASNKDFGWGARKEPTHRPEAEAKPETPGKPAKEQEFTFWAFPNWRRTPAPRTPSAEKSRERV